MPRRKGIFRTRHKTGSGKTVYAKRNRRGRFVDIQSIKRAARDRRIRAKTTVKPGYGFRGDIKRKKNKVEL